MKVVPLTMSQINWPNLIQSSIDIIGRSPVVMLDQERNSDRSAYAFTVALSELKYPAQNTNRAIQTGLGYLEHLYIGFLVECNLSESAILCPFEGLVSSCFQGNRKDLLIISGTLLEWVTTINQTKGPVERVDFLVNVSNWLKKLSIKELINE
jgi:hypothetical protein